MNIFSNIFIPQKKNNFSADIYVRLAVGGLNDGLTGYMSTFQCLYCVSYTVHLLTLAFILFHSEIPIFRYSSSNWLFPLLCIINIIIIIGNAFQVFRYGNQHPHSKWINFILQGKICAWFWLSIGFSKTYCHYRREPGYSEPIYPTGVELGETFTVKKFCTQLKIKNKRYICTISSVPRGVFVLFCKFCSVLFF
jgi:hypothetical protein